MSSICIVIPAFNESKVLPGFLAEIEQRFSARNAQIVVVDDRSTDDTPELVRRFAARSSLPCHLVAKDVNEGHGPTSYRAWLEGVRSGADIVLHTDGDGPCSSADLERLADCCLGADGAVGVRRGRHDPWFRKLLSVVLRMALRALGANTRDANSPIRAYRSPVLSRLLQELPPSPVTPSVYLTVAHQALGYDVDECDVAALERGGPGRVGTMWSTSQSVLPSHRLIRFSLLALIELGRFMRNTRRSKEGKRSQT